MGDEEEARNCKGEGNSETENGTRDETSQEGEQDDHSCVFECC